MGDALLELHGECHSMMIALGWALKRVRRPAEHYKGHIGQAVASAPGKDINAFGRFRDVKRRGCVERTLCCIEAVVGTCSAATVGLLSMMLN